MFILFMVGGTIFFILLGSIFLLFQKTYEYMDSIQNRIVKKCWNIVKLTLSIILFFLAIIGFFKTCIEHSRVDRYDPNLEWYRR